jgi:membrane-associated protease RseP (regulator of RpoE activity)
MKQWFRMGLLVVGCISSGCGQIFQKTPSSSPNLVEVASYNQEVESAQVLSRTISRADLRKAISHGKTARVVELLYGRDSSPGYKQYRLFGVDKESPYALLGLENADIIVAANGYVLNSPDKLPKFIGLLPGEQTATLDVRRSGRAIRFSYTFVH